MKKKIYKTTINKIFEQYQEVNPMYATKNIPLNLRIPPNFRMLCVLLDVKPTQILNDFMTILSSSYKEDFPVEANRAAIEYLLKCGYGKRYFYDNDIVVMLNELEAARVVGETMDNNNGAEMDLYFCFRHMQSQHWFKTWFNKNIREEPITVLNEY